MITRNEAKKLISDFIKKNPPIKTGVKTPLSNKDTHKVHRLPIKYLVPNIYNDRIAGRIREFEESHKREMSFENKQDLEEIYKFIDIEHPKENKTTYVDLMQNGQREHGIITNDGIVLDGNRRLTLLRKISNLSISELKKLNINKEDFEYFDAIVYLEDLDKKGIIEKETQIQIAREGPITYNRINLYIKIDNMVNIGFSFKDIATYMGHNYKENQVKNMHDTFQLMCEYLTSIGKKNQFTLLDGLEDQFINSKKAFNKIKSNKTSNKWFNQNSNFITEFKTITFELLRAKVEGKNFRSNYLGKNEKSGILVSEKAWQKFIDNHKKIVESNKPISEADWGMISKSFDGNIKSIPLYDGEEVKELSVDSLISAIHKKTNELKSIIDNKKTLSNEKCIKLKEIEKVIRNLRESYGEND
jgi:hypothetical protein